MSRGTSAPSSPRPQQQGAAGRGKAEWITLGISIAVIAALLGLVTMLAFSDRGDAVVLAIEPLIEEVRQEGDAFYLPVEVRNDGGRTAEDVQVEVTLVPASGDEEAISFTIRFLDGGETARAVLVFHNDPRQGEVSHVVSYLVP